MSENLYMMQIQADLLGHPILKAKNTETTALGAGFLAGLSVGYWKNQEEIHALWQYDQKFERKMDLSFVKKLKKQWKVAIDTATFWSKNFA